MAVRILMLVAVLMALYGCGLSPETKDSSEGLEPLGSEASVFGAVVLTGQNVEMEINVVELADRPGLLLVGAVVLILLVSVPVMVTVLYLIRWLLSEGRLNRLRTVLTANWLRTAWIGLGVLFFVMVVVPGALLIYQYSGIGD
jgi:hypothetical protein